MEILDIVAWLVFGLGMFMALTGFFWIRRQIRSGEGVTYATITSNLAYLVAVIVIWMGNYSPFHLLWLFPASFAMGFLAMGLPFSTILVPLAKLYGIVASIGLDEEEVARNTARVKRFRELIAQGIGKDDAVKLVLSEEGGDIH